MIPKCVDCLQKHLASCKAEAFEVGFGGHSAGGNPDHRVDFSGEMIEAEKHAALLDKTLSLKIRALRRTLQSQRWKPTKEDIEKIGTFWNISFVIDGVESLNKISLTDPDFAKVIAKSLIKYDAYPIAPDQSDISKNCPCGKKNDNSANVKNEIYSNMTYVLYASDHDMPNDVISNIKANVSGIGAIAKVPKSFEKWPKEFIDNNVKLFEESEGNILCLWPENIIILRRTNVLAFPSIKNDKNLETDNLDRMYCEKKLLRSMVKFLTTPIYISFPMLKSLCDEYYKITGRKEISDIYSLIRNFDNSPSFDNINRIFSDVNDEVLEKTLFKRRTINE